MFKCGHRFIYTCRRQYADHIWRRPHSSGDCVVNLYEQRGPAAGRLRRRTSHIRSADCYASSASGRRPVLPYLESENAHVPRRGGRVGLLTGRMGRPREQPADRSTGLHESPPGTFYASTQLLQWRMLSDDVTTASSSEIL